MLSHKISTPLIQNLCFQLVAQRQSLRLKFRTANRIQRPPQPCAKTRKFASLVQYLVGTLETQWNCH